jgi:hypothetical protein
VALRIAERLGPGQTVVTVAVAVHSGMKYLSTEIYAQSPDVVVATGSVRA